MLELIGTILIFYIGYKLIDKIPGNSGFTR